MRELFAKNLLVQQVDEANAYPGHLVFVGRTNAPASGADATLSAQTLAREVDRFMIRGNEVRSFANLEERRVQQTPLSLQGIDLFPQHLRINHHAVADHAYLASVQHPRRDQSDDGLFPANHQGMTRVIAALKSDNDIGLAGQQIYDFPFAFIAPLNTDYD